MKLPLTGLEEFVKRAGRPENEIKALIAVLAKTNPDILGVCEIGTQEDLDDLGQDAVVDQNGC